MESLYLLLPLSLVFVALIGGVLWWSIFAGQYDDPDGAGQSILSDDDRTADDLSNSPDNQITNKTRG